MSRVIWILEHTGDSYQALDREDADEFARHLRTELCRKVPVIVVPAGHTLKACETMGYAPRGRGRVRGE